MNPIAINGAYSVEENGWVSETLKITDDILLEVELPGKGRVVIKKAEQVEGPYPKALITKWAGPKFSIRVYGSTENRYIRIVTTETPNNIQYVYIRK